MYLCKIYIDRDPPTVYSYFYQDNANGVRTMRKTYTAFNSLTSDTSIRINKNSYEVKELTLDGIPFIHYREFLYIVHGNIALILSASPIDHVINDKSFNKAKLVRHLRIILFQLSRYRSKKCAILITILEQLCSDCTPIQQQPKKEQTNGNLHQPTNSIRNCNKR